MGGGVDGSNLLKSGVHHFLFRVTLWNFCKYHHTSILFTRTRLRFAKIPKSSFDSKSEQYDLRTPFQSTSR